MVTSKVSEADVPRLQADVGPSSLRYVCLDFETNGFPEKDCKPMPWSSYPIQVSLTAVENGEVVHLYDSYIQGAESFNIWVAKHVPITFKDLSRAPKLPKVIQEIAAVLRPTDWLVAHNARFDFETCLARTGQKERIYSEDLHFILSLPRFCTMNCSYVRSVSPRRPTLALLCKHFGVDFDEAAAHDATYDSLKLACCVAEAGRRGVMLDVPYTVRPAFNPLILGPGHPDYADYIAERAKRQGTSIAELLERPSIAELLDRPLG